MIKPVLKYAILCGLFLSALFYVSIKFGSNPLIDIRHLIFDAAIFFLFIFFAGKEFKDFKNDGIFHFWQGISIGLIVLIPSVIIFSLALYVIFESNPLLIEGYKEAARNLQESQKELFLQRYPAEVLEEQLKEINATTSVDLVSKTFIKKLFAGFLVTPVVSIILRKKPK